MEEIVRQRKTSQMTRGWGDADVKVREMRPTEMRGGLLRSAGEYFLLKTGSILWCSAVVFLYVHSACLHVCFTLYTVGHSSL